MYSLQQRLNKVDSDNQKKICLNLKKIKLLALDVDGVLTDGSLNLGNNGEIFKSFNAKDGLAISLALRNDLKIAIITGRKSNIIHKRAEELGITLLYEGIHDKAVALTGLMHNLNLTKEQVAYMGDDLNDLPAFSVAGMSFAPLDAAREVLERADIVADVAGGKGAVRNIIEQILKAKNLWDTIVLEYASCGGQGDKQ